MTDLESPDGQPTTNTLEVTSHLTLDDWRAYQVAWAHRLHAQARIPARTLLTVVGVAAILAVALVLFAVRLDKAVPFAAVAVGACAAIFGVMLNMRRMRTAAQPDAEGVVLGQSRVRFDSQGMHLEKSHSSIRHEWALLQEITRSPEHLFVWVDRVAALIIPLRDLPAGLNAGQATEQIRTLAKNAAAPGTASASDAAPAEPPLFVPVAGAEPAPPMARARRFVAAVGRFLTLRTADGNAVRLGDGGIFALVLGCLGLWLLLDWLSADESAQFYGYGLIVLGWYASVLIATALAWSRLAQPRVDFRSTLALALGFIPVAIVLTVLALSYLPDSLVLGALILVALYSTFYANAGLRSITSYSQPRAIFAGLLIVSLAAWFAHAQYASPQFWYAEDEAADEQSDDDGQEYEARRRQMEPLLFQQAQRIDESVAAIDRPADLPAAGFFVGFAGVGEQHVFASEIELAEQVIGARYGTTSRSLRLVNDQRDLETYPFASPTALRRTLATLAEHMNLEQDVLFLALSSHGSAEGDLSVSNGGIPVNDL
ncbi:MAG TPA: hypothetical protein VKB34_02175, partial [Povalibacter sp.]|nr:hypothetical protein [Povalibacter sp.]